MGLLKRNRRLLAFLLTASLVLSPLAVFGEEIAEETSAAEEVTAVYDDSISEDTEETEGSRITDPEEVAEALLDEVEELKDLKAGEDYKQSEGVFLADSYEEALDVADSYNAELISFDYGVATVRFKGSTVNALNEAALSGAVTRVVEPNYTFELDDVDDDFSEEVYEAIEAVDTDNADTAEEAVADEVDTDLTEDIGAAVDEVSGGGEDAFVDEAGEASDDAVIDSVDEAVLDDNSSATSGTADPMGLDSSSMNQYYHKIVNDVDAHKVATGKNIKIAVLDTGVNPLHEDLQGKVSVNWIPSLAQYKGIDIYGHGTHVIGIIAAEKNNGKGGYGVAPGVSVDSIQVTYDQKFNLNNIVVGINMAIEKKVDIISMSLGSDNGSDALKEAVEKAYQKGIICVAAAGNSGKDTLHYPAAYDCCLAVGSRTKDGKLSYFSNYGDWVDIVAPGGESSTMEKNDAIYSTYIYNKDKTGWATSANAYYGIRGTSQATPIVTGVLALCYSANENLLKEKSSKTVDMMKDLLTITNDGKEYSCERTGGSIVGMVQADKAVELAKSLVLNPTYTLVDPAGHFGCMMSGYICKGKTVKLRIGTYDGTAMDKNLTRSATWESSDPSKVSVKNGKVKAQKSASEGDRVLITAVAGGETLFYLFTVHRKVRKFGYLDDSYRVITSDVVGKPAGNELKISSPYALLADDNVRIYYTNKKGEITGGDKNLYKIADRRFTYDVSINKRDLGKFTVTESDSSGDPISIIPQGAGTIRITYKLLDGSNKKFTVRLRIN